jgi:hypothetical protein
MAIVCRRGVTSVGKGIGFYGMAYQIGGIPPICAAEIRSAVRGTLPL